MLIEQFSLKLIPMRIAGNDTLEVKIIINNLERGYQRTLHPTDMETRFDQIFEIAKIELRNHIMRGPKSYKGSCPCGWKAYPGAILRSEKDITDVKCPDCGKKL